MRPVQLEGEEGEVEFVLRALLRMIIRPGIVRCVDCHFDFVEEGTSWK